MGLHWALEIVTLGIDDLTMLGVDLDLCLALTMDMAEMTFEEALNVVVNCVGTATAKRILSVNTKEDGTTRSRVHSSEDFVQALMINTVGKFKMCRLGARRIASRDPTEMVDCMGALVCCWT